MFRTLDVRRKEEDVAGFAAGVDLVTRAEGIVNVKILKRMEEEND